MDRNLTDKNSSQSHTKVLSLLRLVGAHNKEGLRLTDLIALSGLGRSTTHRLLGCLTDEGFVERIPETKRYRLGLEAMQLGLAAAEHDSVGDILGGAMQRLARMTDDTVFIMVRSGHQVLCVKREEGAFPVRALLIEPGMRRLLGLSTTGIHMLSTLPDEDVEDHYARHDKEYREHGVPLQALLRLVHETREAGYTEQAFFSRQVYGVGFSVSLSPTVRAGLAVAAIQARMSPDRRREISQLLHEALAPLAWQTDK